MDNKLTDAMIETALKIIQQHCPMLLTIIGEREFAKWLEKGYDRTQQYPIPGTPNLNFTATFFRLVDEIRGNGDYIIQMEFKYFNYLLNQFWTLQPNNRAFKNLVLAAINNFNSDASFLEVLSEVGICISLAESNEFKEYEHQLRNGKSIDLLFSTSSQHDLLVEVVTIHFDASRFENCSGLKVFLVARLKRKFDDKTYGLTEEEKKQVIIVPVIYDITNDIIKNCSEVLKDLPSEISFNSVEPRFFGNIGGKYFNLFTIDDVNDHPSPND